jgi:hypothetical protein
MSKFTPGPWKIIPGFCKMKVYAGEKYQGHFCIADCHQFDIANDPEAATIEKEANAALIAAAPAMYESLKALLDTRDKTACMVLEAQEKAHKALRAAERGE